MPKVGYAAIIGRPNAGKSTLINTLIGEKVSVISPRPQTTQRSIRGIFTDESKSLQIIFIDTPGIHGRGKPQFGSQKSSEIHDRINTEAFSSLKQADVIIRLLDPTRAYGDEDTSIDDLLEKEDIPILRVETKQDLEKRYSHKDIDLRIDSTTKEGFMLLLDKLAALLPEGPYLYESDYYTDQPMDFRIGEVIRERLFAELGDEIPYAAYVEVGEIDNTDPTLLKVQAYIQVESDSQKVILIGKQGKMIQTIGMASRLLLEDIFQKRVFLALRVKVMKNWRKNEKILDKIFPKR